MSAAIPVVRSGNHSVDDFAQAVKQTLDTMSGQRQNLAKLLPLASTASTAEIITQLNAMLQRMQG